MMGRLTLGAAIVLILSSTSPTRSFNLGTDVAAQAPSSQMMSEMKASDSRLDALVNEMNAASGDAKVNAVAVVVTELVRQQKSLHDWMGEMHQRMMGGRGMMMKK
jgi:hypothetical protein